MILTKILTIYIRSCDFHRESRSLASYMMHLRAWWVSKRPSWLRYWIACGRSPRDHFDALAWSQSNLPTQHEVRTTCSTSAQPSKRGRDSAKSQSQYVSMEQFLDQKPDQSGVIWCHLVSTSPFGGLGFAEHPTFLRCGGQCLSRNRGAVVFWNAQGVLLFLLVIDFHWY